MTPLLIFGLRNPTARYANTRHNAGAMVVQRLAKRHGIDFQQRSNGTVIGRADLWGRDVRLILPGTYMNNSGQVVAPIVRRFGRRLDSILIVIDEMDLPLGTIRLRPYGSAGGHNGMKSIIESLGADAFPRLRIGVGRPQTPTTNNPQSSTGPRAANNPNRDAADPIKHVLSRFRPDEQRQLESALERATDCIETLIRQDIDEAMNQFNGLGPTPP